MSMPVLDGAGGSAAGGGNTSGLADLVTVLKLANQNTSRLIEAVADLAPFAPDTASPKTLNCTTSSQSTQLLGTGNRVRVANDGDVVIHIAFGAASTVSATTDSTALQPWTTEVWSIPPALLDGATRPWLAARTASSTGDLNITTGAGT